MGINAVVQGPPLLPEIAQVADDTTPREVATLLRAHWRPCVMGAWLSVRFRGMNVEEALIGSIRTCQDGQTAAPLATAAIVLLGARSLPVLEEVATRQQGADGYFMAALEHLGGATPPRPSSAREHEVLEELLLVAQQLQTA